MSSERKDTISVSRDDISQQEQLFDRSSKELLEIITQNFPVNSTDQEKPQAGGSKNQEKKKPSAAAKRGADQVDSISHHRTSVDCGEFTTNTFEEFDFVAECNSFNREEYRESTERTIGKFILNKESGSYVNCNQIPESSDSSKNSDMVWNRKRPIYSGDVVEEPQKKKRKKAVGTAFQLKNAICQLNEIKPGLQYELMGQSGPVHLPVFTISVQVNGECFEGKGHSKKQAKAAAAEAALRSFLQFKNTSEAHQALGTPYINSDFSADVTEQELGLFNISEQRSNGNAFQHCRVRPGKSKNSSSLDQENNQRVLVPSNSNNNSIYSLPSSTPSGGAPVKKGVLNGVQINPRIPVVEPKSTAADRNPVMTLNELHTGIRFECAGESGEAHSKRFTMKVFVGSEIFEGTGPSKKMAKTAAAKSALAKIYNLNFCTSGSSGLVAPISLHMPAEFVIIPHVMADHIARLVTDKFSAVMSGDVAHSRKKVLAGIVMTTGTHMEDATVISVATGTKCVNGEHISETGSVVNDCHAEIIARRCLRRFLYSQLELLKKSETESESIFERRSNGNGYRLKENIHFHLFINTAPCGDARIFSPHEVSTLSKTVDRHPNRKARGQLRTKIESGEGTIPVRSSDGIQTWDGVLQGQRLLTMSCSDKIARWNVMGLQGALLSHFIDPIYLETIVLGSLFHPSHMYRAVCSRVQTTIQGLPPPYRLNKPQMGQTTSAEVRQASKAPNFSINWVLGFNEVEIINAFTGKEEQGEVSRLSKSKFFSQFQNLVGKISAITGITQAACPSVYRTAKHAVSDYQIAQTQLYNAFQKAELGKWLKKPMEQDEFVTENSEEEINQ